MNLASHLTFVTEQIFNDTVKKLCLKARTVIY